MGLFGIDSNSSTSNAFDQRVAATDQAQVTQGGAMVSNPYSINLRTNSGGSVLASGAQQSLGASRLNAQSGGINLSESRGNNTISLTSITSDPAVLEAALKTSAEQNKASLQVLSQGNQDALAALSSVSAQALNAVQSGMQQAGNLVSSMVASIKDITTNAQTGGDASRNNIVLYVVLGVLALLGGIFIFGKKS